MALQVLNMTERELSRILEVSYACDKKNLIEKMKNVFFYGNMAYCTDGYRFSKRIISKEDDNFLLIKNFALPILEVIGLKKQIGKNNKNVTLNIGENKLEICKENGITIGIEYSDYSGVTIIGIELSDLDSYIKYQYDHCNFLNKVIINDVQDMIDKIKEFKIFKNGKHKTSIVLILSKYHESLTLNSLIEGGDGYFKIDNSYSILKSRYLENNGTTEIGFNSNYMLDALKFHKKNRYELIYSSPSNPMYLTTDYKDCEVILPVRIAKS